MNPLAIFKPEFLYRPQQVLRRVFCTIPYSFVDIELPWGLPLRVNCDELIGRRIWANGVFELAVSEVVWRLTRENHLCIDAGANIGYITSIMACRAGASGTVYTFEPHPAVYKNLTDNVHSWKKYNIADVKLCESALSASCGIMELSVPASFAGNMGLSSLCNGLACNSIPVRVETIDSIVGPRGLVDLIKIDVEGHEASVIKGAGNTINRSAVRDIVFEDHHPYPSESSEFLIKNGYKIFLIQYSWFKPVLVDPKRIRASSRIDDTTNYLATMDPERAFSKMRAIGWHCLVPKHIATK